MTPVGQKHCMTPEPSVPQLPPFMHDGRLPHPNSEKHNEIKLTGSPSSDWLYLTGSFDKYIDNKYIPFTLDIPFIFVLH